MAITHQQAVEGWHEDAYTTTAHAFSTNPTAGSLCVIVVNKFDTTWDFVLADLILGGTATRGTTTLDVQQSNGGLRCSIFSFPITVGGSVTVQLTRSQAGSGTAPFNVGMIEYAGADVSGSRLEDSDVGSGTTDNPTSASMTSASGAAFVGALVVDTGTDYTGLLAPANSFVTVFEEEDGSAFLVAASADRIVAGGTSVSPAWTINLAGESWATCGAVYKTGAVDTELKISEFTALTDPIVTDLVCIVDSTTSSKLTINNLLDLFISDVTMTVLTATSGATYAPPAEAKKLLIGCVGGGGGGNGGANTDSAGGGGGGGGTCLKLVSSTAVTNGTYVVGPGGGVSSAGTASSGRDTTFNIDSTNIMTGGGGGGGTAGAGFTVVGIQAAGGAGGPATGGDLNMPGKRGERGVIFTATAGWGGSGGDSVFGFGSGSPGVNTTGSPGGDYGGGGCGAHASAATNKEGAAGAKGTIFVLEFYG